MAVDPLSLDFGSDKPFYIYLYRDPRRGKTRRPIYVGKGSTKRRRADQHWKQGANNPILRGTLSKIKRAGLEPIIEIIAWFDYEADAFRLEMALIKKYGRKNLGTGSLTNLTDGGEGIIGATLSETTRKRMSAARMGHIVSVETKAKISKANSGKKMSPEQRKRFSDAHLGIKPSLETRKRLSEALMRRYARMSNEERSHFHRGLDFKGRKHSDESRKKMSDALVGKPLSPAHKLILSQRLNGRPKSPETKAAMSAAQFKRQAERRAKEAAD